MKLRIARSNDPKPKPKVYQSQSEIDADNAESKRFSVTHHLLPGNDANIGDKKVGDPVVPYIDLKTGKDITGQPPETQLPPNTITDIRKVPYYVMPQDIKYDKPVPYYIDQQSGDEQPIHPDIARSTRFVPTRGKYDQSILAYAKK